MTLMIERIYIHNYKCLVNFDLQIKNPTVLLFGANGVGKTAVLDVMFGLRQLLAGDAKVTDRVAFHPSTLTRWQTGCSQVFELQASVSGESFIYRLEVEHETDGANARISRETLTGDGTKLFAFEQGEVQLYGDDGALGPSFRTYPTESALARVVAHRNNTRLSSFLRAVRRMTICEIRPYRMRADSTREDRLLDRHAENFVDWYRHLLQENPASVSAHVEALRPVMDGFRRLRLERVGLDTRALMLNFDGGTGSNGNVTFTLSFDELSDGQRASIVLYALLHPAENDPTSTLFIDLPDHYMELSEIQPWLIELFDLCGEDRAQAVLCSHHPELIDYLGPDQSLLLVRDQSGRTTARPPSYSPSKVGLKLSELVARGWVE